MKTFTQFLEEGPLVELAVLFEMNNLNAEQFCLETLTSLTRNRTLEEAFTDTLAGIGSGLGGLWRGARDHMSATYHQNAEQGQRTYRINANFRMLQNLQRNMAGSSSVPEVQQAFQVLRKHLSAMFNQANGVHLNPVDAGGPAGAPDDPSPEPTPTHYDPGATHSYYA